MRVAALYDIHGNLPALEAVLAEADADLFVIGGDVAPGPRVPEVLDRLQGLDAPVRWVMGNGDREVVEGPDAGGLAPADVVAWSLERLSAEQVRFLAGFEPAVTIDVEGLGQVLFCHGSPRSDTEMITQATPDERLRPMLAGVTADIVVCGHTHHQFDRIVDGARVVNAGSVGLPYQGDRAAFWLSIGPGIELRRTQYDTFEAVEQLRASGIPGMEESIVASLVDPISAQEIAEHFEQRATSSPDA